MDLKLEARACGKNAILPVVPRQWENLAAAHFADGMSPFFSENLEAGALLYEKNSNRACFRIYGKAWLPFPGGASNGTGIHAPLLLSETEFSESGMLELELIKNYWTCAIITMSDKGAEGLRQDRAGPAIGEMLAGKFPDMRFSRYLIRDDANTLKTLLTDLALSQHVNLIVTNGGTGISQRDVTPQTTSAIVDYELPGFSVAMLEASLRKTPNAAISRAVCGVLANCLVINVPGSLKGAVENLEAILPALNHALVKLNGDTSDCGG